MAGRDVSQWCTGLQVTQRPRELHREWAVTLVGFTALDRAARWDIVAEYGAGGGTGEVLVRQGIVPPDWQPTIDVGPRNAPVRVEVRGVDWAWIAARVRPPGTLVIAPDARSASRALAAYRGQGIGRTVHVRAETMHGAVRQMGKLAGFTVAPLLPDYRLQGHVVDAASAVWDAIWALAAPFAPVAYARRERNEIVIADRVDAIGGAEPLGLGADSIASMAIEPIRAANLRRIVLTIPRGGGPR